ncbi:hypothetical protein HAX54_001960 [Datura stramonium]|uniref:Uncharacterized protein n=1 Tax=Datura stramonium TaxID=4076 RepID=A0ABS8T4M6_DATST|nr:hypothetical protein [Datura stramonium]
MLEDSNFDKIFSFGENGAFTSFANASNQILGIPLMHNSNKSNRFDFNVDDKHIIPSKSLHNVDLGNILRSTILNIVPAKPPNIDLTQSSMTFGNSILRISMNWINSC